MQPFTDPAVDEYMLKLLPARDAVLAEMEEQARQRDIPIVGPAVGRLLFQYARLIQARKVFELGSAIGYSTLWWARAVGPGGEVFYTDGDPGNAEEARGYLERAGVADRVRIGVGDALEQLAAQKQEFDIIFNDVDKEGYPGVLPLAASAKRIVIIGSHADKGVLAGSGSSLVYPRGGNAVPGLAPTGWPGPVMYYPSSPMRAIQALAPGASVIFVDGSDPAAAVCTAGHFLDVDAVDDLAGAGFGVDPVAQVDEAVAQVACDHITRGGHDLAADRLQVGQLLTFTVEQVVRAVAQMQEISRHRALLRHRRERFSSLSHRVPVVRLGDANVFTEKAKYNLGLSLC